MCFDNELSNSEVSQYFESVLIPQIDTTRVCNHYYKPEHNIIILLNSLFKNSDFFMKNPDEAELVIKKLFKKMLDYTHQPYFIAYYLFTVQRLIYHESNTITKNQNVIVSRLISSEMRIIFSKISAGNYANSFLECYNDRFLKFNYKGLSI